MGTTRSLLQSRSPKVRTQNLTIDVPVMAADPDVTSEQRTELLLALIDAYPLYRDRPSRLLLQGAADSNLRSEAQKSSDALVKTDLFKQAVASLGEKVDEFGEVLSKQRGEQRMCARLYELACMVLRRVMQADTEAALRESENWMQLMLVHARLCDLIFCPEHEEVTNICNYHQQVHATCAWIAVNTICSVYEGIPLLFETIGKLAARLPTPTPALAALEWPIDACLYLRVGKEQERGVPGHIGRKFLHDSKDYLLKLFVTHIVCSQAVLPSRSLRAFHGLFHTEVGVADVEQSVLPQMDETFTRSSEQVLRVAIFLASDARWPRFKSWYAARSRARRRKRGVSLHRDKGVLGHLKRALTSRLSEMIYPSIISTDPGTRDAAFSLFKELCLYGNKGYELLSSVLRAVRLEDLAQPGQRQSLCELLDLLPKTVESMEFMCDFVTLENQPELLDISVPLLVTHFDRYEKEPVAKFVSTLLTKLDSEDPKIRAATLAKLVFPFCGYPSHLFPREASQYKRVHLMNQLLPAVEACLMLGASNAYRTSDAALEACAALRIILHAPKEFCTAKVARILCDNPILQQPLQAKPTPSFLLDTRVYHPMIVDVLFNLVSGKSVHALQDPEVKDLFFQQMRKQVCIRGGKCATYIAGSLHCENPSLAAEFINYLAWSLKGVIPASKFGLPLFFADGVEDFGSYEEWLPKMIVTAHIWAETPQSSMFEEVCNEEYVDARREISSRVDEYLAEIDAASRDPIRAEAAAAAYQTAMRLAPEAVLSRTKRRL